MRQILKVSGGDEGDRTPYLLNAIQALSQVSYTPVKHLQLYLFYTSCQAHWQIFPGGATAHERTLANVP